MKHTKKAKYLKEVGNEPCMEELLIAVNGMKNEKMFLNMVKRDKEGNLIECFTKKGAKMYNRLLKIIHGVLNITGVDNDGEIFTRIQDELDDIVSNDW